MRKVTGGSLPAELWHDIMTYAHRDKPPLPLPGLRAPWLDQIPRECRATSNAYTAACSPFSAEAAVK